MPGIAGVISTHPDAARDVAKMRERLMHEPTYVGGEVSEPHYGFHVAWASHAGAFSDRLPLWNAARDVCLVFCGEEFADASVLSSLRSNRHRSCPDDASYLIAMYEQHDTAFLAKLNGWFSGLLIDLRRHIAILFNDRFGLNRIYWRQTGRGIYFSSEAKALLRLFPDSRALSATAVAETFSVGCVLQGRTLFRNIELLPPASQWTFDGRGQVKRGLYFTPSEWEGQSPLAQEDFYAHLKASFARLLPRYFRGPGRVAMSLTGGLDGRMIMAWARQAVGDLPCFSFNGSYRDCSDVRIARRIALHCGQTHSTINTADDFISEFAALAPRSVYLSDGSMDVSGAVELYVNRLARVIAPIRMTGNYGSEILRTNVAFRPRRWPAELFEQDFYARIEQASGTYQAERRVHDVSFVAFKQVPWHHYARLSVEQSQLTLRSPFLDNELVALMYRAPAALRSSEASLRLIHDGDAALGIIPTDRGLVYGPATLAGLLRITAQELSAKAEYVYDYGMPQWLACVDTVLRPLQLERLFLGRHKFYHFRTWYRNQLASYVLDMLLHPRTLERSYLRPQALRSLVKEHVSGRGNHTLEIHRALTLELIHRELLDP